MRILIATDGSDFSEAAVKQVCRIVAKVSDISIRVVSIYEPPLMAVAAPYASATAVYNPSLEKEMKEFATRAVSLAESNIRALLPDWKEGLTTEVLCGTPAQEIVGQAEKWSADLIALGSHGYRFWERVFLGSVSNQVVHHAPCSVLIVRMGHAKKGISN